MIIVKSLELEFFSFQLLINIFLLIMSTFIHGVDKVYGNMSLMRYIQQCFCCVMAINM